MLDWQTEPPAAAAGLIRDSDGRNFEQDVLAASMAQPVIVDFWAPWCGPCQQLTPLLEKAVLAAAGALRLVKVDIDRNPDLAQALRIQSVPTVYAFFQGRPVDGFTGARPESELRAFIERLRKLAGAATPAAQTAEEIKKILAEADQFFQKNQLDEALSRYSLVMEADDKNAEALAGIGWCLLMQGDAASVRELLAQADPPLLQTPRFRGLQYILALEERAVGLEDAAALEKKAAANPADLHCAFDLALHRLAAGRLEEGIAALTGVVRQSREGPGQKARELLIEIFEALGPHHPLTLPGRRKLSAVLFS